MLSLTQTQWFSFKICNFKGCLFQTPLHNLKRAYVYGTLLFCNSFNSMRIRSSSKKQSSKRVKLQAMAALTNNICNKAISKTESTKGAEAQQHIGSYSSNNLSNACSKQGRSRNKPKESIKSGKEFNNDKRRSNNVFKRSKETVTSISNTQQQQTSSQTPTNVSRYVNVPSQIAVLSSSHNAQVPQNIPVTYPPLFFRSFSDTRIPQQHLNMMYSSSNSGPTNNHSNRCRVRRSTTGDASNRTAAADRDKQLAWALRSWQRTPFGKKLAKHKLNLLSCTFTVMSYNVLAQELLTEHSFLYRKHNPRALLWEQRWNSLLEEIKRHNADILCLQEVQASHIDNYFNEFKKLGYEGVFKQRTGMRTDGCAIYYKTSMFNLVEHTTVEFNQSSIPVLNRDNVAIIAKFSPKQNGENQFVVATTHLLYNPKREDVRLAQTQVLLSEVDRLAFKKKNLSFIHEHLPIIITGDFNLTPDSSVYDLITRGILQYEHLMNRSLARTNSSMVNATGKFLLPSSLGITDQCQHADLVEKRKENIDLNRDEELQLVHLQHTERYGNSKSSKQFSKSLFSTGTLSHDLTLKSAYEHTHGEDVEATTYQDKWVTVDYIFYSGVRDEHDLIKDGKLKLISRYTIPTRRQLQGVRIPNFAFGSDHISLLVKFKLDP